MKINNIALIALLSISLISPMQQDRQRNNQLVSILKDAENRLQREKSKSKANKQPVTNIPNKPLKKAKIAAPDDTGNRLSTSAALEIQTDKDFFERRIQLTKALQKAHEIPSINGEDEKQFSQMAFSMIDAVIDMGKYIGGISHQNTNLAQEDLSPFIDFLMTRHPLLDQRYSPLLCISSKGSLDKFNGKYQDFEFACKAIKNVIPAFPIPQEIKDDHFNNLFQSITSFQGVRDFNDQIFINIMNRSFPDIEIFDGLRKDLLNAIAQKNKAFASDKEKLRQPLYSKQSQLMEKIQDNMDRVSLNDIKQEIDQHFPVGNPNWQDLRESLLDALQIQIQTIESHEQQRKLEEQQRLEKQKNGSEKKEVSLPVVAGKPEAHQKPANQNKSTIKPEPKAPEKTDDSIGSMKPTSEPLKKESVISPAKVALFTGLGLGCILFYLLFFKTQRALIQ